MGELDGKPIALARKAQVMGRWARRPAHRSPLSLVTATGDDQEQADEEQPEVEEGERTTAPQVEAETAQAEPTA